MKKSTPRTGQTVGKDSRHGGLHPGKSPKIPPLLFEGDEDITSKPLQILISHTEKHSDDVAAGARLLLIPRDPHSVYAHWDITPAQKREFCNALPAESLVLNVHHQDTAGRLAAQIHVTSDSNHTFLHLADAGSRYVAQLGHRDSMGAWIPIATSTPVVTPYENISLDRTAQFAQMPASLSPHVPEQAPIKSVSDSSSSDRGSASLVTPPRVSWIPSLGGKSELPGKELDGIKSPAEWLASDLNPEQEGINDPAPCSTEEPLIQRQQVIFDLQKLLQATFEQLKIADSSPLGVTSPVSPGFFLTVGTELIVHGATHPNAQLIISGSPVALRPDGTFSCHFALPQGELGLTVEAYSADGNSRRAELRVLRQVGGDPQ